MWWVRDGVKSLYIQLVEYPNSLYGLRFLHVPVQMRRVINIFHIVQNVRCTYWQLYTVIQTHVIVCLYWFANVKMWTWQDSCLFSFVRESKVSIIICMKHHQFIILSSTLMEREREIEREREKRERRRGVVPCRFMRTRYLPTT